MALTPGQQYSWAQIYQEDPNYVKIHNPAAYSQYTSQVAAPGAALTGQNLSNAGQAIDLPGKQANTNVAVQTAPSQISTSQSDAALAAQKAKAAQFLLDVTNNFAKAKKDNGGAVPAPYYNEVKAEAPQFGIDSTTFDSSFAKGNVDPNKEIQYNTDQGVQDQGDFGALKRSLQYTLDQWNKVPGFQKQLSQALQGATDNPYIQNKLIPDASSYENQRLGLAAKLSGIAGGGSGSGLRLTQPELQSFADLLPSPTNSDKKNADNLTALNNQLMAKYNIPQGLDPQYLPGYVPPTNQSQGGWQ